MVPSEVCSCPARLSMATLMIVVSKMTASAPTIRVAVIRHRAGSMRSEPAPPGGG
jgi:hypothetical protein